jgi:hypothetical protein
MKNARVIMKELLIRGKEKNEDMELNGSKEEDLDELAFGNSSAL